MVAHLLLTAILAAVPTLAEAIARHAQTLGRISSYHLKMELYSAAGDEPGAELQHDYDLEVWYSDGRHRSLRRIFHSEGRDKTTAFGPFGDVWDMSVDSREARALAGWDPEHPFPLPLELGRNAREFDLVRGSIQPFDPTTLDSVLQEERANVLWDLRPEWPLMRLSEACELIEVPQHDPAVTRLKIASTTSPDLGTPAFVGVGSIIDLDQDHGWLISRIETPFRESTIVSIVTEYREAAEGVWYPVEIRSTFGEEVCARISVLECQINQPIPDASLQTQFPEGARVNDASGLVHLWGKAAPERSFEKLEDFMAHVYSRAQKFQGVGDKQAATDDEGGDARKLLLIANAVIVALIVVLTLLRRRLTPSNPRPASGDANTVRREPPT